MTIDTLGYVKKLEAAGMDRRLAEAQAEAMNEQVLPRLATAQDILRLENKLDHNSESLENRIENSIASLENKFDHKFDSLQSKFENLLWRHTVAIILTIITVGGFLVRFMK